MNILLGVIIGLIVLMILVTGHEFGHFIMARRNGVTVKEFGIGFPPRAIAWTKGKDGKWHKIPKENWSRPRKTLVFSLNWLPIGGFCQMDGESDADTRPGTFGSVSFWKKTKILFGGVMMNWLMAFLILTVLAFTGMPKYFDNQFFIENDTQISTQPISIVKVVENSPASQAGLKVGDKILASVDWNANVNNTTPFTAPTDLTAFNQSHAGQTVTYEIITTDDKRTTIDVHLNDTGAEYLLGITMSQDAPTTYRAGLSAPVVAAVQTVQLTGETFRGFGTIIYKLVTGTFSQFSPDDATRQRGRTAIGEAGDSFSGPVGILGTLFPSFISSGPTNVAFLAALISVSLACMNVLPIPALDGGRWVMIAVSRLRGKKLTKDAEAQIIARSFIVLFALVIIITVLDIIRLFH